MLILLLLLLYLLSVLKQEIEKFRHLIPGVARWPSGSDAGLAISRSPVRIPAGALPGATLRQVPDLIPVLGSQPAGDRSHEPGGRLPLLSSRPAVTSPVAEHHCPLASTKLYWLVTEICPGLHSCTPTTSDLQINTKIMTTVTMNVIYRQYSRTDSAGVDGVGRRVGLVPANRRRHCYCC